MGEAYEQAVLVGGPHDGRETTVPAGTDLRADARLTCSSPIDYGD